MSISTTKFASKNHFFERRMSLCCSTYLLHIYLTMQNKLTNYIFSSEDKTEILHRGNNLRYSYCLSLKRRTVNI